MGGTLFDIKGDYLQLMEMMNECVDDEELLQVISDSLEAVKGELEVKAEGYIHIIQQMEMEADRCEVLEYEWGEKKKIKQNAIKRLKDALKDTLITTDNADGLKSGDYTLKVVKNGGMAPIIYDNEQAIPQNLMKVKYEKDAGLIRKYLEDHPECEWAHIGERGTHLAFK